MSVIEYEQKFTSLVNCVPHMQLNGEEKACMFEENLTQRYKDLI